MTTSRQIVLAARPEGRPTDANFRLETVELPALQEGQVLVRNEFMSVDPYMRPRMDDRKSYIPPFQVDQPLDGGAVGTVIASEDPDRPVGSVVAHGLGWRDVALLRGRSTALITNTDVPISYHLGILGMPGLTAFAGLTEVASFREGDAVFVSGAAGAVGGLVGQFAKILGASRVVGSAGTDDKVAFVTEELGFDDCMNYRTADVHEALPAMAPDGIDVYFDNVGGDHLAAALDNLKQFGRVAACGSISEYNSATRERSIPGNLFKVVGQRITIRGFISTDHAPLRPQFVETVSGWISEGKIVYRETVTEGLDNAPTAFMDMLSGGNTGKAIVRL